MQLECVEMGRKPEIPFGKIRKVMIRSANWVGDAVMSLPAIDALRMSFPQAEISILTKPWVAELYQGNPALDRIILYESPGRHQGFWGKWRLSREIRGKRFELALLLQNAFEAAWISCLAGIPTRAGYNTDARTLLLTHPVAVNGQIKQGHQVHYYLGLVRALGCQTPQPIPMLRAFPAREKEAQAILKSMGLSESDRLVGISPGATFGSAKEWFAERFGELAERITGALRAKILIFGSPGDQRVAARLCQNSRVQLFDLTGRTSLGQAIALIARCRLFVSNDSGLMHVAAALRIPLVAIFGSTDPQRTGPLSPNSRVVRHSIPCGPCLKTECPENRRCMDLISVDEVYKSVMEFSDAVFGL